MHAAKDKEKEGGDASHHRSAHASSSQDITSPVATNGETLNDAPASARSEGQFATGEEGG